jgi:hypothetical protein
MRGFIEKADREERLQKPKLILTQATYNRILFHHFHASIMPLRGGKEQGLLFKPKASFLAWNFIMKFNGAGTVALS